MMSAMHAIMQRFLYFFRFFSWFLKTNGLGIACGVVMVAYSSLNLDYFKHGSPTHPVHRHNTVTRSAHLLTLRLLQRSSNHLVRCVLVRRLGTPNRQHWHEATRGQAMARGALPRARPSHWVRGQNWHSHSQDRHRGSVLCHQT